MADMRLVSRIAVMAGLLSLPAGAAAAELEAVDRLKVNGFIDAPNHLEIVHPQTDGRLTYAPAVFTCTAGNWCDSAGWGGNKLGSNARYTFCEGNANCSANSVELTLNANVYRSVLFSHLDWTNTYTIAVYLSFDGGVNYALHKAINTRRVEGDGTPYTSAIRSAATNLPLGVNVRVRLVAAHGRMHFEGFGLSKVNLPEEDLKPFRTVSRVTGSGDDATCDTESACGPSALAARSLTLVKTQANTAVRVHYTDNVRSYSQCDGCARACRYYIRFNGAACPSGDILVDRYAWHNLYIINPLRPGALSGYCTGLAAGTYTVQVYTGNTPGYWSRCYTGWTGTSFMLEAEEIR